MQKGDFCLRLLKQEHSPLAAIVAAVGEVQWPVGKDAPVLKVWNRRYTFALPGLVYGLIFPAQTTPLEVLQQLEAVMDRYCTFEVHREIAIAAAQQQLSATSGAGGGEESRDMSEEYWTVVAPGVETTSAKIARQICSTSSIVADSIVIGGEWASLGIQQAGSIVKRNVRSVERGVTPRMLKRMQQARRMSAVAKVMSRSLLKGAISATGHVLAGSLAGLDVNAAASLYDHITTAALDRHQHSSSSSSLGPAAAKASVAVASVDAFAKLVEAVETAGKSVYGATSAVRTDLVQHSLGAAVGNVINTAWTLNKMGLQMLLQVTAASTAISTRKRTCSATRYSSTDHVQQQQQQLAYHQSSASATSTEYSAIMPPTSTNSSLLFRQITLSPQQHQQLEQLQEAAELAIPLNLLSAAASPNSADHHLKPMRTQTFFGPALTPAALHSAAATSSSSTPTSPAAAASKVYCNSSSLQRLNAHGHHPFVHPKSPFRHYTEQRQHSQPKSSPYNFSLHLDQSKAAP